MTCVRSTVLSLLVTTALALAAFPAAAQNLYWIDTRFGSPTLNRATPDGIFLGSVSLPAGSLPEGLAVDAAHKVYWAEGSWSMASVNRAAFDLSNITAIVTGASALRGIAVDDVDSRLYWTSSNLISGSKIHRSYLDGSGAGTLAGLPIGSNPRGIAVDHGGAKLYWADFDANAIVRANLDGSLPGVWATLPAGAGPYGVAFDPAGQDVYWTEYNTGQINRAPVGGGDIVTLVTGLGNPTYLALDVAGGRMYWSEGAAGAQRIQRATLAGGSITTLPIMQTTYGGLAFASSVPTPVPGSELPAEFALGRPSPSPAAGPVRVSYALPREGAVRLTVLDLQGREIAVLAEGVRAAGRYEEVWSGKQRRDAAAGVYFVRMVADGRHWVQRVVLTD